jgi:hypothetical protein
MRIFVIVLTMTALATPALAQGTRGGRHHQKTEQKADDSKVKANDKDYKAALDRLPAPTQKYDAWGTVRPNDAGAKKQ